MTLNTPILNIVDVFDAVYPHTFTFSYSGQQAIKNRVIIKYNTDYSVVYDKIQDGLRLNHVVPANTLINGKTYIIQVQVFDAYGNYSNLSDAVIFNCYTTPAFYFSNINNNDIISTANLQTNIIFSQDEGDSLKECLYYLYDSNKNKIYTSDTFFHSSESHVYYGLENMESYYVRTIGKTVYGFSVDTGYIKISVQYNCIPTNIAVVSTNKNGKILIQINIISTDYDLENDNYKLENGELTLINNTINYHVKNIEDFTLIIKARKIPVGNFANVKCDIGNAALSIEHFSNNYFCKLKITNNNEDSYVIYEDILGQILSDTSNNAISDTNNTILRSITGEYNKTSLIVFEIHRKNGLYSLSSYYQ